jgi:hypothetical protein
MIMNGELREKLKETDMVYLKVLILTSVWAEETLKKISELQPRTSWIRSRSANNYNVMFGVISWKYAVSWPHNINRTYIKVLSVGQDSHNKHQWRFTHNLESKEEGNIGSCFNFLSSSHSTRRFSCCCWSSLGSGWWGGV